MTIFTTEKGHLLDLDNPQDRVLAAIFGEVKPVVPRPPAKRTTLFVHPQGQPNVTVFYVPLPNGRVEVIRKVSAP